ncbi:CD1247 N-terminal domain-containing protein [Scatolibacter rhodanostii]|uniref:CD1247 N-terminal domain-containing protein n=1 Tax=Scatolibacter rhodanostii TaxID=2014781 RepID=UPI000C06A554|nr:CD1247 N-terminal domain-containing protein [Scatolibacter rhodanostii]
MTNLERAAYVRGLMEGLELDPKAKETKVLNAMMELLEGICDSMEEIDETIDTVIDEMDEIDEDLGDVERAVYGIDDEDEDDCGCGHDHHHHHHHDDDEWDDVEDDETIFEATCPTCGELIPLTMDTLEEESIECPKCGETLEFDFDEDDEDCDCGDGDGCHCGSKKETTEE